jgi:hypothetical protein
VHAVVPDPPLALARIERNRARRPSDLPPEIPIGTFDRPHHRAHIPDQLQRNIFCNQ